MHAVDPDRGDIAATGSTIQDWTTIIDGNPRNRCVCTLKTSFPYQHLPFLHIPADE